MSIRQKRYMQWVEQHSAGEIAGRLASRRRQVEQLTLSRNKAHDQLVELSRLRDEDRERADRMTRALAGMAPDRVEIADGTFEWACCGVPCTLLTSPGPWMYHADDCAWIEARRWVDANPEMTEHEEWLADLRADRSANMKDVG